MDHIVSATHKADDLLAANGRITLWILGQRVIYWNEATMIATHHEARWTKLSSNWNPALLPKQKGCRKQGRPAKKREDNLTNDATWLHGKTA